MKILNKSILALVLMFAMIIPAMAQFENMFTEENFTKQPPLSEKDVQAFIKSEKVYNYLAEMDPANAQSNAQADAYVKKELGISLERYIFVVTKIAVCYTFIFESGVSGADLETIFQGLPVYFRASAAEQALLHKYKTQIETVFNTIS